MRKGVLAIGIILFALFLYSEEDNCFTIIAGRETTSTGSVMIAHNEDDHGHSVFVNIHKVPPQYQHNHTLRLKSNNQIPQVKKTLGFLWLQIPEFEFGDSYFNQEGVVIVSNKCKSRETNGDLTRGGIGFMLRRVVAERAKSARDAVAIAGDLISKYGYYPNGRTLCIADSQEGWILHMVQGKHWVAQRVPDNEVAVIANAYTIGRINLADKASFMGSSDLIEYALKKGWLKVKSEDIFDITRIEDPPKNIKEIQDFFKQWKSKDFTDKIDFSGTSSDPQNIKIMKNIIREWRLKALEEKFDFAKIYSDPENLKSKINTLRQWRAINLLAKKKYSIDERLPFSFSPNKRIGLTDLFAIMRDHYEGTKYDLTNNYKQGSPNSTANRTICTASTRYSVVAELRNNLAKEINHVAWIALRRPDSNAFIPWYFSITSIPEGYEVNQPQKALADHFKKNNPVYKPNLRNAFWNFDKLSTLVDLDYKNRSKIVRKEWINLENYIIKRLKKSEKEFMYILERSRNIALNLITNYTHNLEYRRWFLATELINRIKD